MQIAPSSAKSGRTCSVCRRICLPLKVFLCVAANMNERDLVFMAVICYAAFGTTSACRGVPPKMSERVYDMLQEHCLIAVADTSSAVFA